MSDFRRGDLVVFGRPNGEKTIGEIVKVNRKTYKVRILENRGSKSVAGQEWKVGKTLCRAATEAEAERVRDQGKTPGSDRKIPSQIPARKPSALPPVKPETEINPAVITDGNKLNGSAMPRILKMAQTLVGQKIAQIGYIEEHGEYWPIVVLENGVELVAQQDDEGNGPGALTIGSEMLCQIF
jgi:hypothetical protein